MRTFPFAAEQSARCVSRSRIAVSHKECSRCRRLQNLRPLAEAPLSQFELALTRLAADKLRAKLRAQPDDVTSLFGGFVRAADNSECDKLDRKKMLQSKQFLTRNQGSKFKVSSLNTTPGKALHAKIANRLADITRIMYPRGVGSNCNLGDHAIKRHGDLLASLVFAYASWYCLEFQ